MTILWVSIAVIYSLVCAYFHPPIVILVFLLPLRCYLNCCITPAASFQYTYLHLKILSRIRTLLCCRPALLLQRNLSFFFSFFDSSFSFLFSLSFFLPVFYFFLFLFSFSFILLLSLIGEKNSVWEQRMEQTLLCLCALHGERCWGYIFPFTLQHHINIF